MRVLRWPSIRRNVRTNKPPGLSAVGSESIIGFGTFSPLERMDFLDIGGVSILVAFAAGLLSVGSPCVLPLVPVYLGYLTGAALEGAGGATSVLGSGGGVAVAARPR